MEVKGLITFLVLILPQLTAYSNKINIKNGSSLNYYLCNDRIQSGMTFMLSSVVDYVIFKQSFCMVQNVSNVTITSESSVAKITCSDNLNGFGFYNTTNLTLCGLVFLHCGGEITLPFNVQQFTNNSNVFIGPHQRAVLLFSNCLNTTVHNVSIQGPYHGFGMLFINALGQSKIAHVNVSNNLREQICTTISTSKNYSCSGSGIVFFFSDIKISKIIESTVVLLTYIQLNNNQNFYSFEENHADILDTYKNVPILSGTGLTFLLYCEYTTFMSAYMLEVLNNKASHIGGILILFNTSSPNFILFSNLNIENNSIPFTNTISYSAGITVISISGPGNSTSSRSYLYILESKIALNKAFKGSGILIHLELTSYLKLYFHLDSCTFVRNQAYSQGSALMIESQKFYTSSLFRYFHVHFRNVSALENSGPQVSNNLNYDGSVFLFSPMNTELAVEFSKFENNVGSVFKVYNNYVSLKENVQCSNNTSNSGSCFHLIGGSYIKLYAGSFTLFNNNKALLSGGAIYADNQGLPIDLCTVASYTGSEKVFLRFENNSANLDGNDIKSQSIYNCSLYYNKTKLQGSFKIYKKIFYFNATSNLSLSSNVYKLISSAKNHQIIFSGQTIHIPLKAIDVANHPVYTRVMVSIYNNNGHQWKLDEGTIYSDVYADLKTNNSLSVTILSLTNTNSTGKLMIQTISHPPINLTFNVFMMECPHGFTISSTSHKCECSTFLHRVDQKIKCDIQSMTVTIPPSSWFGTIRDQDTFFELFSFNCPPQYCKQSSVFTPSDISSKSICNNKRTGIMCGQCDNGLSLVFGSEECHQCSNYWILSLIFYAIGGVCLVLTLFFINLTVSSGMLGGIIFFANMSLISLHSDLLSNELYTRPINIMMSFLNLNLGFPVCFYNGMDNITKTALLFSFPLYLWCIVLGLVLISRHSTRVANLIVGSSVQVLATLIHFSFAKLLLNIFDTLTSSNILTSHNNSLYTVWYFDGNIKYFTGSHLVLCVVSITVLLLFILPYLLFLSFASYLGFCRSLNYYLRPMIDAYNGPYKDRYRFWFGMRQWLMVALYVLYSIKRGSHPDVMLAINIIAILFFMTLQICVKPFKNVMILFIDTWFLFLLICANVTAFLSVSKNTVFANHFSSEGLTAILLVYLVSVSIIILCHVFVSTKILRRVMKKVSSFLKATLFCLKKITDIDENNIEHYRAPLLVEVLEEDLQ